MTSRCPCSKQISDYGCNVAVRLNADPRIAWFHVRVVNQESIHNHSAFAHIEKEGLRP